MDMLSALSAQTAPVVTPPEHAELMSSRALLLLTTLLVITLWTSYLLQRHRIQIVHESVVAIVLGSIVGLLVRLSSIGPQIKGMISFQHTIFFNVLLPPIILHSGYELKEEFFLHLTPIATFAFAGLSSLTFVECLMMGCILSSTDPVAVLAIFSQLRVDQKLYSIIFGESILNDSVAIVMFNTLQAHVSEPFTASSITSIFGVFLGVFWGSLFIGVAVGLLCSLIFKHSLLFRYPNLESCIVSLIAYMSYLAAQACQMSGIVALLFAGITLKHYGFENMSLQARQTTTYLFGVLSQLSENFIFIYLGITLFAQIEDGFHPGMIISCLIFILIARYASVFPFARLINAVTRYRNPSAREPLPRNHQIMLWWAGLRGAVSFALSLEVSSPSALYIRTTTLIVVIITIVFFGGTVPQALRQFGISSSITFSTAYSSPTQDDNHSGVDGAHNIEDYEVPRPSDLITPSGSPTNEHLIRYFPTPVETSANWFVRLDKRYLQPFFCRPSRLSRSRSQHRTGSRRSNSFSASPSSPSRSEQQPHHRRFDNSVNTNTFLLTPTVAVTTTSTTKSAPIERFTNKFQVNSSRSSPYGLQPMPTHPVSNNDSLSIPHSVSSSSLTTSSTKPMTTSFVPPSVVLSDAVLSQQTQNHWTGLGKTQPRSRSQSSAPYLSSPPHIRGRSRSITTLGDKHDGQTGTKSEDEENDIDEDRWD